jgi:thiosulfate/3-mercaptopyruvate sulfurtransferase
MPYTTLIDAPDLARLTPGPGVAIVDCRFDLADPAAGRGAWLAGHIPGALHADLNRDLSAPPGPATGRHPLPDPQHLAARLGELGIDNATQVIAYDQSNGAFAARLWWLLRWLGHGRCAVLDGGFDAWRRSGGAVRVGEETVPQRRFTAAGPALATADSAAVAAALSRGDRLLVDARAVERYAGDVEPIDPVAGHIPGARNAPFSANLGGDGRFLPASELRARWRSILGDAPPGQLIAMCGSGVTACHNLLALEIAGLPGAALYPGSWSEWIRDPSRPVATGR